MSTRGGPRRGAGFAAGLTAFETVPLAAAYPVPGGGRKVAPVNFARVHGGLQRRVGARRPFGFFVAFLPPAVKRRYYTGPADRLNSERAVEVSAFDPRGRRISLVRHDN